MNHILITKNAKIILTDDEKKQFTETYQNTKSQLLSVKGHLIDRMGIEVYELEFFLKQESDKLKSRGLRRCRKCGDIVTRSEKCPCSDNPKLRADNIFQAISGRKEGKLLKEPTN